MLLKKCVAFTGDNCNTMFEGLQRNEQGSNVFAFCHFKSYFLSQEHPLVVIKRFFENEMSELYLWHAHSLMSVFHGRIQAVERENNSVAEVLENLELVLKVLVERKNESFMSFDS